MNETDPPRRLRRGEAQEVESGRRRAVATHRRLRNERQARAVRHERCEGGERFGAAVHVLRAPHGAGAQHLVAQAVAFPEREERSDVGMRQVRRPDSVAQRPECGQPLGAPGKQEAVLEQLALGELQQTQGQGENRRVQTAGEKAGHEGLARSFHDVELDSGRRGLQTLQESGQHIGCHRGDDPEGDSERTRVEALSDRFQEQRFVQDPEGLRVHLPAQRGKDDPAALALQKRRAQRVLQLADLERERRLRDVDALRRPAERAVFHHRLEVAQLAQRDGHDRPPYRREHGAKAEVRARVAAGAS